MTQQDKENLRKLTSDVLYNYTKRCATVVYIQSMSFICSFVCQIAYFGTQNYEDSAFWLFSSVLEEILPVGYFSHSVEPLILQRVFNRIFEILDPEAFKVLKTLPSALFTRYFVCLFTEFERVEVALAIMDLLLLLGSGSMTTTLI